jgi:hypothetical protein
MFVTHSGSKCRTNGWFEIFFMHVRIRRTFVSNEKELMLGNLADGHLLRAFAA